MRVQIPNYTNNTDFFAILLSPVLDGFDQLLSFITLPFCCQLTRLHQEEREKNLSLKKSWKHRESNPGRWGAELERFRCAMATPYS